MKRILISCCAVFGLMLSLPAAAVSADPVSVIAHAAPAVEVAAPSDATFNSATPRADTPARSGLGRTFRVQVVGRW